MKQTLHIKQRQHQRGITKSMVDLAIEFGTPLDDKYVLGRKEIKCLIVTMGYEYTQPQILKTLMKLSDKGGIVVVAIGNTLITTYNYHHRIRT